MSEVHSDTFGPASLFQAIGQVTDQAGTPYSSRTRELDQLRPMSLYGSLTGCPERGLLGLSPNHLDLSVDEQGGSLRDTPK
jgi:hypothetical protein